MGIWLCYSMWSYTVKLDEKNSKCAGLAQEIGFGFMGGVANK